MPSSAVPPAASSATATGSVVLRPPVPLGEPVRLARRTMIRLTGSVVTLVVLLGFGSSGMLLSGEPLAVALGLTLASGTVLLCVFLACVLTRRRDGRIEVVRVWGGLELPPTKPLRWASPLGVVLVSVLAVILIAGGASWEDHGGRRGYLPIVGVMLAVIIVVGVLRNPPTPSGVPRIALTPHGVGRRRGQRTRVLDCDAIVPPELHTNTRIRVVVRHPMKPLPVGGDPLQALEHPEFEIPFPMYASDPNLVLALIEHYRTHPGDRAELAGPEVIDRLRRGDLHTSQ